MKKKVRYLKRNKKQIIGIALLMTLLFFAGFGIILSSNKLYNYYNKQQNLENYNISLANFKSVNSQNTETQNYPNSLSGGGSSGSSSSNSKKSKELPIKERLLKQYEESYEEFQEIETEDKTIFYQQREINGATVEKDYKVYQFDKENEELVGKKSNWRDLEDIKSPKLTQEEAEALIEGEIYNSRLMIISPDSDVFLIEPIPENPCWIITSIGQRGNLIVNVIDSVTGEKLGYGIPPPSNAFVFSGPQNYYPSCTGTWDSAVNNAQQWFERMHYTNDIVDWPTKNKIKSHMQSNQTKLFYEVAHGDSFSFDGTCAHYNEIEEIETSAEEIEDWISNYNKMAFTFLASCDAMCETGPGTFSYAFRKGSNKDTATVGYCGMSEGDCFYYHLDWQNMFFDYLNGGYYGNKKVKTIKEAFDQANEDFPACAEVMRFEGDENLKLVNCNSDYEDEYCCGGEDQYVCRNRTCSNLAGISFTKPYSERLAEDCGESYCEEWSNNYCENEKVYRKRTCHNKGCSKGECFSEEYEKKELIEDCEYECGNAECLYPDLTIEDIIIQGQKNNEIILAFTIRNLGEASANPVYWKIDSDSPDTNPERTEPVSLAPVWDGENSWTRAYMKVNYSEKGNYNPKVILDFNNILNEKNENNNELSIPITI